MQMVKGQSNMSPKTYLKALVLGLVAVAAPLVGTVYAAPAEVSTTVFERALQHEDITDARFDVNRQLGRAWIDVEITPTTAAEVPQSQVIPRMVDGLYYDQSLRKIIYRSGWQQIVCAEDWSFLGATSLKDTGQCRLNISSETRAVDDGFQGRQETIGKVVFEARSSTHGE
jgi:hypothetical protein